MLIALALVSDYTLYVAFEDECGIVSVRRIVKSPDGGGFMVSRYSDRNKLAYPYHLQELGDACKWRVNIYKFKKGHGLPMLSSMVLDGCLVNRVITPEKDYINGDYPNNPDYKNSHNFLWKFINEYGDFTKAVKTLEIAHHASTVKSCC